METSATCCATCCATLPATPRESVALPPFPIYASSAHGKAHCVAPPKGGVLYALGGSEEPRGIPLFISGLQRSYTAHIPVSGRV